MFIFCFSFQKRFYNSLNFSALRIVSFIRKGVAAKIQKREQKNTSLGELNYVLKNERISGLYIPGIRWGICRMADPAGYIRRREAGAVFPGVPRRPCTACKK